MQKFLTNAQMRSADLHTINELGVPSSELMERAGRAIADRAAEAARGGKRVAVVCGAGNNGGDGYVAARLLCGMSIEAVVVDASFGSEYSKDCAEQRAKYRGRYVENLEGADVVIDCIFGTGLSREVSGRHAEIIAAINDSGAYVIAADIPSGINGDNGAVMGAAVMADMTVAIAAYKLGHVLGELSEEHGGEDDHPVAVLEYPAEVVLSHVDGAAGARFQAHPAVHAGVFVDGGLTVPHPDGLRRAQAHAVRASDAGLGVHF